jgi:hypothetical protein
MLQLHHHKPPIIQGLVVIIIEMTQGESYIMPSSKVCWSKRRFHEETPTFSYSLAGKTWKNYMFVGSVYTKKHFAKSPFSCGTPMKPRESTLFCCNKTRGLQLHAHSSKRLSSFIDLNQQILALVDWK